MSDMVVVFESTESFWAEGVMDALQEEGFHPELADDAGTAYYHMEDKNPGVVGMPQGMMKVCIVVPRQEEAAARLFLRKRDEPAGNRVTELTGGLRRSLVLSILAMAVAFIIMACLWGEPVAQLGFALLIVLPVSFILTANAALIHNIIGQICALIIIVAAVVGGSYCVDQALVYTGCFLLCVPFLGIVYIFLRSRKKNNTY